MDASPATLCRPDALCGHVAQKTGDLSVSLKLCQDDPALIMSDGMGPTEAVSPAGGTALGV